MSESSVVQRLIKAAESYIAAGIPATDHTFIHDELMAFWMHSEDPVVEESLASMMARLKAFAPVDPNGYVDP